MLDPESKNQQKISQNAGKHSKSVKKILLYLDEQVAHGCGHVGIIFVYQDKSAEQIYQSAENPDDKIYRLILLKQPVRVIIKKRSKFRYIYQFTGSKTFFTLHTAYGNEIREAADRYKSDNKPYNSLTNNCCHFIHFILNFAPDVRKKIHILPKQYYKRLLQMNKTG